MTSTETSNPTVDAARCPLCGKSNECQLCTAAAYKGPCWCMGLEIPAGLHALIPVEARNRACVCRDCVETFRRSERKPAAAQKIVPGDFYFDGGMMVFTAAYLSRRGFCCGSGCRHCPYPATPPAPAT